MRCVFFHRRRRRLVECAPDIFSRDEFDHERMLFQLGLMRRWQRLPTRDQVRTYAQRSGGGWFSAVASTLKVYTAALMSAPALQAMGLQRIRDRYGDELRSAVRRLREFNGSETVVFTTSTRPCAQVAQLALGLAQKGGALVQRVDDLSVSSDQIERSSFVEWLKNVAPHATQFLCSSERVTEELEAIIGLPSARAKMVLIAASSGSSQTSRQAAEEISAFICEGRSDGDGEYVDWKRWSAKQFGHAAATEQRYFDWHVKRAISRDQCSNVLEIGFGNGAFLGFCKLRGWSVVGIERETELRARAQEAGFAAVADLDELPPAQQFDLIALFDVLEHIPAEHLIGFTKSLAARLHRHGAILIRVPNGDSPFARHYQHGDLTHVTAFGLSKLDHLARLCGLRVIASGEAPWTAQQHDAPSFQLALRALLRFFIGRVIGFAYFSRSKIDLSPNLMAVMKRV